MMVTYYFCICLILPIIKFWDKTLKITMFSVSRLNVNIHRISKTCTMYWRYTKPQKIFCRWNQLTTLPEHFTLKPKVTLSLILEVSLNSRREFKFLYWIVSKCWWNFASRKIWCGSRITWEVQGTLRHGVLELAHISL